MAEWRLWFEVGEAVPGEDDTMRGHQRSGSTRGRHSAAGCSGGAAGGDCSGSDDSGWRCWVAVAATTTRGRRW